MIVKSSFEALVSRCGADGHHAELPRGAEWIRAVTTLQHHHNTNNNTNSSTAVVLRVVGQEEKELLTREQ